MSNQNTGVLESVREPVGQKGPEEGTDEKDQEGTVEKKDQTGLFQEEAQEDEKVLKWRFLAKGEALDSILAVFGARPVDGDKQTAFRVKAAGDRELGDVVRALFLKAHKAGVTLGDLVKLISSKTK